MVNVSQLRLSGCGLGANVQHIQYIVGWPRFETLLNKRTNIAHESVALVRELIFYLSKTVGGGAEGYPFE